MGPPEQIVPYAEFLYPCETDLVCKVTHKDPPQFNSRIFFENKEEVGICLDFKF